MTNKLQSRPANAFAICTLYGSERLAAKKGARKNGYRVTTATKMLARIKPHLQNAGITRLGNINWSGSNRNPDNHSSASGRCQHCNIFGQRYFAGYYSRSAHSWIASARSDSDRGQRLSKRRFHERRIHEGESPMARLTYVTRWDTLGGGFTSGPGAVIQTGGRLVVFGRGTDGQIYHRWQVSYNGDWSNWEPPGPFSATSDPAACLNAPGGLVVFARGTDNALWHSWQDSPNSNWNGPVSLGGGLTSGPAAVLQTRGRLAVFVRGTDGAVWHRWQVSHNGSWSDWESIGGVITSDPAAALNADGGLVVFARGTDNTLLHTWQDGPDGNWSGWVSLGGSLVSGPAAGTDRVGRLTVVALHAPAQMKIINQLTRNGSWSAWRDLQGAGPMTSDPDIAWNGPGQIVVFGRGIDNAMWHRWEEPVWVEDPPSSPTTPPTSGSNTGTDLLTLWRTDKLSLYYNATVADFETSRRITSVQNVSGYSMRLEHSDGEGTYRSTPRLEPGAKTSLFDGQLVVGEWGAINLSYQGYIELAPSTLGLAVEWAR